MKYIKLFEAFDLPEKVNFTVNNYENLIEYLFNIDNYKFRVSFKLDEDDDITWERSYKVINYGEGYQTFDSKDNMAKKIITSQMILSIKISLILSISTIFLWNTKMKMENYLKKKLCQVIS